MKKVALTLASIAAIATFAPEASAVPVFARQTGMACSACHFQHFPLLNAFGRAFKANAFTMVGSEPMVEGEGLSIPDRLNMAGLTSAYVSSQSGAASPTHSPEIGVPASGGELSIFWGGKVSDNAGFLSELGMIGGASTNAAKLVTLYPVGDMRAGLAAYTTGQGAGYGLEYLNTGAVDAHKMMGNVGVGGEHGNAAYAARYMGAIGNATGASAIVDGSWGMATVGVYAPVAAGTTAHTQDLTLTYGRIVGTFDLAGWDSAVGVQSFGGTVCGADQAAAAANYPNMVGGTYNPANPTTWAATAFAAGSCTDYALNIVDAQMQGEIAGMSTGFYAEYGSAPAGKNGNVNAFAAGGSSLATQVAAANNGTPVNLSATTLNLSTTVEVVKGTTLQLAARFANLSDTSGNTSNIAGADNAIMIGATYQLAQNINLGANYTMQSGSAWDAYSTKYGTDAVGKTAGTVSIYALF